MILRCQHDAYQRRFETHIVSVRPLDSGGYVAELADTILFPEGGGQPCDHGTLNGVPVSVARVGGAVEHRVATAIQVGPATLELDWERRYDHMQQHTAQHLITAIAADRYGWRTTSFHLGAVECSIDLDTERVSAREIDDLAEAVNVEIRAARPVNMRLVAPDQLQSLGVRTRGLPDGHTGEVRLIEIAGVDRNTCGGTHVANTAQLQSIHLLGTERIRGAQTRLFFNAGARAREQFAACLERQRALVQALSVGPHDLADAVARLQADLKAADRDRRDLRAELAGLLGARLAETKAPFAHGHRRGADMAFLNLAAAAAQRARADLPVFLTAADSDRGEGLFLLVGPADAVKLAGPPVASFLDGRGGGPPGRFQGKVGAIERLADALDLLRQVLAAT